MPNPAPRLSEQRVCSEDGTIFVARGDAVTCSATCRTQRKRRTDKGRPEPYGPERRAEILAGIRATAEEGAVAMAQEIMREEIRPVVREALTSEVMSAIGDMVALLPLSIAGLRAEMEGVPLIVDGVVMRDHKNNVIYAIDGDRRLKAIAMLHKATVGSAGLAPQAPDAKAPPIAINFGDVPRPNWDADTTAAPLRECEICEEDRPEDDFVGGSNRCASCDAELRAQAEEIAAG